MDHYDSSAGQAPRNLLNMSHDCSACAETKPLHETTRIDDSPVCHDCVRQMFTNAIESESNYPPRWGNIELDVYDYAYIIGGTIASRFAKKLNEYQTPWISRVYCRTPNEEGSECGKFLGRRLATSTAAERRKTSKSCSECGKKTCRVCEEGIQSESTPHECKPTPQEDIPGLERGKDYQKCPGCGENIELREGCNHVVCEVCFSSFCYICGQPAEANSNHWSRRIGSQCPRYNQPGAQNAMWEDGGLLAPWRDPNPAVDMDDEPLEPLAPLPSLRDRGPRRARPHPRPLGNVIVGTNERRNAIAAGRRTVRSPPLAHEDELAALLRQQRREQRFREAELLDGPDIADRLGLLGTTRAARRSNRGQDAPWARESISDSQSPFGEPRTSMDRTDGILRARDTAQAATFGEPRTSMDRTDGMLRARDTAQAPTFEQRPFVDFLADGIFQVRDTARARTFGQRPSVDLLTGSPPHPNGLGQRRINDIGSRSAMTETPDFQRGPTPPPGLHDPLGIWPESRVHRVSAQRLESALPMASNSDVPNQQAQQGSLPPRRTGSLRFPQPLFPARSSSLRHLRTSDDPREAPFEHTHAHRGPPQSMRAVPREQSFDQNFRFPQPPAAPAFVRQDFAPNSFHHPFAHAPFRQDPDQVTDAGSMDAQASNREQSP